MLHIIALQTPKKDNEVVLVSLRNDPHFYHLLYRVIRGNHRHRLCLLKRITAPFLLFFFNFRFFILVSHDLATVICGCRWHVIKLSGIDAYTVCNKLKLWPIDKLVNQSASLRVQRCVSLGRQVHRLLYKYKSNQWRRQDFVSGGALGLASWKDGK